MPTETTTDFGGRQAAPSPNPDQLLSAETAKQRKKRMAVVEEQCDSHGRHPAQWDRTKEVWISPEEPAVPYAVINSSLPTPKRCRELICEVLGAGVPIACTAHQDINNAIDQRRVAKEARPLLLALRGDSTRSAAHVTAAVRRGLLQQKHQDFTAAVQERVAQGADADDAVEAVAKEIPGTAGTVTMAMLQSWIKAMADSAYNDEVRAARNMTQAVTFPGEAPQADTSAALGTAAEKAAQYIAGFYYMEVKQAKLRRSQGKPARPVLEPAASPKRSAPDGNSLPSLPPGCQWGYCTPDRMFVPFDPDTRTKGDAFRVGPIDGARPTPAASGAAVEQGDVELLQLARLYQPVLWAPERAVLAEQAWRLYLAEQPGAERTEAAAKEAASTKNTPALRELRVEHFAAVEVRQLVREVALAVQERLHGGAFDPTGSAGKACAALKAKTLTLNLPERDPNAGSAIERLMALQCTAAASSKAGPSPKRHKA